MSDTVVLNSTAVAAIYIGQRNAEALTGQSFRYWRDHAEQLGLEILRVNGKSFIRAAQLAAAIERAAAA